MVQPSIRYPQPADAAPLRRPYLEALLWFVTLPSGVLIALYATRYFLRPVHNEHFARYLLPLRFHVAGGIGALLAGPWQFSETLRRRELNLHRLLGRCYLLEVLLGSPAGFAMAAVSEEGLPTHLGFGMLAVLWFYTGLEAYRSVLRRDIRSHRRWMIRNFALTLSAVTLRIYLPFLLAALHWSFRSAYIMVAWLCSGTEPARRRMAGASRTRTKIASTANRCLLAPDLPARFLCPLTFPKLYSCQNND